MVQNGPQHPSSTFIAQKKVINIERQQPPKEKSRSGIGKKQHSYYVDISDLTKTLTGVIRILERTTIEGISSGKLTTTVTKEGLGNFQMLRVAGGDQISFNIFKFIEDKTSVSLEKYLQTARHESRSYLIEDGSLLTTVFFNSAKDKICQVA